MFTSLPNPPDLTSLDPLLLIWERGRPFTRCHHVRFGATEFNPGLGPSGRFHPFTDGEGKRVPTLYAADNLEGALSETVFHNVPVRGPGKRVAKVALQPMVASVLACDRDLTLVKLYGLGLSRLGVLRDEMIETPPEHYGCTAAWAQALHASDGSIDGLVWVSRQNDAAYALVLFGDRVERAALQVIEAPKPLYFGPGLDEVLRLANQADITIFE